MKLLSVKFGLIDGCVTLRTWLAAVTLLISTRGRPVGCEVVVVVLKPKVPRAGGKLVVLTARAPGPLAQLKAPPDAVPIPGRIWCWESSQTLPAFTSALTPAPWPPRPKTP